MKILLINGSPKTYVSSSECILNDLRKFLSDNNVIETIKVNRAIMSDKTIDKFISSDVFVFSFPVYVDSLPSHLLTVLDKLSKSGLRKNTSVYSIANCGFYEGRQTEICHRVIENFCNKTGLSYCGGVGVGGGAAYISVKDRSPMHFPKHQIGCALQRLAFCVDNRGKEKTEYVSIDYAKSLYMLGAHISWKIKAVKNGVKISDIGKQL